MTQRKDFLDLKVSTKTPYTVIKHLLLIETLAKRMKEKIMQTMGFKLCASRWKYRCRSMELVDNGYNQGVWITANFLT